MKLVHREISDKSKDTSGSVTLVPEEMEDMWHIYNLIAVGDYVKASTIRYDRLLDMIFTLTRFILCPLNYFATPLQIFHFIHTEK